MKCLCESQWDIICVVVKNFLMGILPQQQIRGLDGRGFAGNSHVVGEQVSSHFCWKMETTFNKISTGLSQMTKPRYSNTVLLIYYRNLCAVGIRLFHKSRVVTCPIIAIDSPFKADFRKQLFSQMTFCSLDLEFCK